MATDERNSDELFSTEITADAAVVADEPRQLYKDGITITVSSRDVAKLQQQGWLTQSIDEIPSLVHLIELCCEEIVSNVDAFITGVQSDGYIDTSDGGAYASALTARSMLDTNMQSLVSLVHGAYAVRAAGTPAVVEHFGLDNELQTHEIDPTQVPLVDLEGNLRAVDATQADNLRAHGWTEPNFKQQIAIG